jgi:hypothetical protein
VSPESKKRANELMKDPAFVKSINDKVNRAVVNGGDYVLSLLPFTGTQKGVANSQPSINIAAQQHVRELAMRYPTMGTVELQERGKAWVKQNFVWDSNTESAIQVPAGKTTENDVKVLNDFTATKQAELKAKWPDAKLYMQYRGDGQYDVVTTDPASIQRVSQEQIDLSFARKHRVADTERATLVDLQRKVRDGSITPQEITTNADLLRRAKEVKAFTEGDLAKLRTVEEKTARNTLDAKLGRAVRNIGPADGSPTDTSYTDRDKASQLMPKGPMLDNKRDVSNLFLKDGNQNAALTALGEGVALRAYKDPARGMNIGIGYNMDANAATLAEDFRRAGIPAEHIEEIKAGTKSISREQAMRLYTAVQPRYEAIAQRGVEKLYPGEWAKLPANQRAVLTDVAYQVGSIDKFTTAIDAFLQNDMVTGGEHLVVKYKDRNTGDYKTDYGRHNLRLAMLQSPSSFTNTLSRIK